MTKKRESLTEESLTSFYPESHIMYSKLLNSFQTIVRGAPNILELEHGGGELVCVQLHAVIEARY